MVPPQNPVPDNYFEFNWVLDEFGRGDYGGTPGPGVLTAVGFGPAIRERFMHVHWAGVDTSNQCYGTINSAIQSSLDWNSESVEKSHATTNLLEVSETSDRCSGAIEQAQGQAMESLPHRLGALPAQALAYVPSSRIPSLKLASTTYQGTTETSRPEYSA